MKPLHALCGVVALSVLGGASFFEWQLRQQTAANVKKAPLETVVKSAPIESRSPPAERVEVALSDDLGEEPQTEIIFGKYEVVANANCNWQLLIVESAIGEISEAVHCEQINEPKRVYANYEQQVLEQLAYSDAIAASELANRMVETEPEKSLSYLVQTFALNPEVADTNWWVSTRYPLNTSSPDTDRKNAMSRYAFALVDAHFRDYVETEIELQHLYDNGGSEADLAEIQTFADRLIARIEDKRAELGIVSGDE